MPDGYEWLFDPKKDDSEFESVLIPFTGSRIGSRIGTLCLLMDGGARLVVKWGKIESSTPPSQCHHGAEEQQNGKSIVAVLYRKQD